MNKTVTAQILLSTYNANKYLTEQLKSIESQSFKDIDILIRDDGYTDNTLNIIESFKKNNHISLIKGQNLVDNCSKDNTQKLLRKIIGNIEEEIRNLVAFNKIIDEYCKPFQCSNINIRIENFFFLIRSNINKIIIVGLRSNLIIIFFIQLHHFICSKL